MSTRKIVTLAAIALLVILIGAKELLKSDSLPKVAAVAGDIEKVEIDRDGSTLTLEKSGGKWLIGDQKYPAAKGSVEKIAAMAKDLKLYEKISSKKNYDKYDLAEKGIRLRAFAGGKIVREITIGKQAASSSQAYVLLKDDPAVYLAGKFSVNDLRKPVDDLRDKEVVKLSEEAITKIEIAFEGAPYSLKKEEISDPNDAQKKLAVWKIEGDTAELDQDKVKTILAKLDPLAADTYLESYTEVQKPLAQLTITAYDKPVVLTIFEKIEGTGYVVKCSESAYYFRLAPFKAEPLLKKKDELKAAANK